MNHVCIAFSHDFTIKYLCLDSNLTYLSLNDELKQQKFYIFMREGHSFKDLYCSFTNNRMSIICLQNLRHSTKRWVCQPNLLKNGLTFQRAQKTIRRKCIQQGANSSLDLAGNMNMANFAYSGQTMSKKQLIAPYSTTTNVDSILQAIICLFWSATMCTVQVLYTTWYF